VTASFTVNVSDANAASDSGNANPEEDVDIYCLGGGRPIAIISGPSPDSFTQAASTGAQTGDIAHGTTATWNTSLSSELDGSGVSTGSVTVTFARRLTNGSTTQQQTVTVTTNSVTISLGSLGPNPTAEGDDASVTWSSNYNGTLYYNSTSGGFTSQSGQLGSGGSGTLTLTADSVDQTDGDSTARVTARYGSTSGSIKDTSNSITLYRPVVAPTPSISITSNNQTDGSFVFTCGESGGTTNTASTTQYRFLDESNNITQVFSADNTYNGTGSERPLTLKAQIREVGRHNTDASGTTGTLTVSQIAADTTFTASSPTITWDASSFTTTLTGVQIGDEVRAVLTSNTGVLFENFTAVTSTTFNLVCNNATVNSTNLPRGTATSVRIQVRRPTSKGGNGNTSNATTFNVTRNYRAGPFASVVARVGSPLEASSTIGAQKYNAYDIGLKEQVRVSGSGVISGATYIGRIVSGTTQGGATAGIIYNQVASGTEPDAATTGGGCSFSQLPTPGNTCGYRITCIIPTNLGGDGVTEHECTALAIYNPNNETEWTITRSDYVAVDSTTGQIILSGTGVVNLDVPFQNYLIANNNTTTNPSLGVATTETSQEYRINNGYAPGNASEVIYFTYGTGNSSLSGTITNSDIVTGTGINYFLYTRVREVDDGTGIWESCFDQSDGTTLVFAFIDREAALVSPTGVLGVAMASTNYGLLIPYVLLTDTGSASDAGNLQLAWSTSTSTPSGWYNVDTGGLNKDGFYFSGDTTYTKVAQTIYVGIRRVSVVTGAGSTPSYSNITTTTSTLILNPSGGSARGFLNQDNGNASPDFISNNDEILLEELDNVNETVTFDLLGNRTANVIDINDSSGSAAFFFTNVTMRTQYGIDVVSGTTSNGDIAGDTIASFLLPVGDTQDTYTLFNPGDLPTLENRVDYEFWRRQLVSQGGNGTKFYPSNTNLSEFFARRRTTPVGNITVTVPKKNLTPTDGSQTITIATGNNNTEYRIRVTGSTDADSDGSPPTTDTTVGTRTGNGTLAISLANLPDEGDTVSYKVQFREAGTTDSFIDCTGTNSTFTIGRIQDFTITDDVPNTDRAINTEYESNTITINGISGTETVTVRKNSNNGSVSWAESSVNGGAFSNSDKSITEGDTLAILFTTSGAENTSRTIRVTFTGSGHVELWTLTTGVDTDTDTDTGDPGAGGVYGLQINNSAGNTLIDGNSRVARSVDSGGPVNIAGEGTTSSAISVSGLVPDDDTWNVIVTVFRTNNSSTNILFLPKFSVNISTNSFTITNNTEEDPAGDTNNAERGFYWRVFKSG